MKIPSLTLALAVGVALVVVPVVGAQADADAPVTIQTIPTATVPFENVKTFTPRYVKRDDVKVDTAVLTVAAGGKVIAKDKTSVKLGKGSYTVRQTVVYRVVSKPASSEPVVLTEGTVVDASCTVTEIDQDGDVSASCTPEATSDTTYTTFEAFGRWADYGADGVSVAFDGTDADVYFEEGAFEVGASTAVGAITTTSDVSGTRTIPAEYGDPATVSTSQKLVVKSLKEPKGCASRAEVRSVKAGYDRKKDRGTGDTPAKVAKKLDSKGLRTDGGTGSRDQTRRYRMCTTTRTAFVSFVSGRAAFVFTGPSS